MLAFIEAFATLCASLFAGAAVYISLVEHPARMGCDTRTAATVWAPGYRRATVMQASLAVAGCLAGVLASVLGGGLAWLAGAVLIGLVVPYTFAAVMPTNRLLLEAGRDLSSDDTRRLLEKWGRLHGVRSVLGLAAAVVYTALLGG
ncbi:DUF1772 domain-containing protein [Crenobacter cavernae]|uniref:DUF1772 domain-containing protein n=1 Tax=Crenobacter cavernae TaxID=2290923 RepID=A0ABY0FDJ8_9NEIS|nr:DUF1772 domain-containing protein [Crenobacter cavernae]RXZ42607.1 DUF1772 domain-containing protein [Crenobacter cavernae]